MTPRLKALDKYILLEFLKPLALICLGLALLVTMVNLVDNLPAMRERQAPLHLIALYHLASFPYTITQIMPVGVMVATLVSLGGLARSSELTAARAGGISSLRLGLPILVAALIGSIGLLVVSETLVPWASYRARYIKKVMIEKRDLAYDVQWRNNMAKTLSGDRQLFSKEYDAATGIMREVVVIQRRGAALVRRWDAHRLAYTPEGWIMRDGVERTFAPDGEELSARQFKEWPFPLKEKPKDFMVDSDKREQDLLMLSFLELQEIINVLKQTGADSRKEQICQHMRISVPFASFILALLGASLPFLFPMGRRAMAGAALGVLVSLGTTMIYLVFIQVGLSLGKLGYLPIITAAWIGNFVFLVVGAGALWKVNR